MNDDTCVCCGRYVPEGRQVCQLCQKRENKFNEHHTEAWAELDRLRAENEQLRKKKGETMSDINIANRKLFLIHGELPTLNEYISAERSHRMKAASMKKKIEQDICWQLYKYKDTKITYPCKIRFVWYRINRKHDPDNVCWGKKVILDSLVSMGILKNDGWNQITKFIDEFYIGEPKVEIEIMGGAE